MFLKNRNISSKIKRSKVTDYAVSEALPHGAMGTYMSAVCGCGIFRTYSLTINWNLLSIMNNSDW